MPPSTSPDEALPSEPLPADTPSVAAGNEATPSTVADASPGGGAKALTLKDLVLMAKREHGEALDAVPTPKAVTLVREVLRLIREEIDRVEDGVVAVPPLGRFKARRVEGEHDGATGNRRRVQFTAHRAKDEKDTSDPA